MNEINPSQSERRCSIDWIPDASSISIRHYDSFEDDHDLLLKRFEQVLDGCPDAKSSFRFAHCAIVDRDERMASLFYYYDEAVFLKYYTIYLFSTAWKGVLSHLVFQSGLPDGISTVEQLDTFEVFRRDSRVADCREPPFNYSGVSSEGERDQKVHARQGFTENDGSTIDQSQDRRLKLFVFPITNHAPSVSIPKTSDQTFAVENIIKEYSTVVFREINGRVQSGSMPAVSRVLCVPVSNWSLTDAKPAPSFTGGIFVGLGTAWAGNVQHFIDKTRRFVRESTVARRKREDVTSGMATTTETFGHQVKKLTLAFAGKYSHWLLTQQQFDELQLNSSDYRIAPFPGLFDGLGHIVSFWSLEHDPDSLLIYGSMIGSFDKMMQHAAKIATQSRKAHFFKDKSLLNQEWRKELQSYQALSVNLSGGDELPISAAYFCDDDDMVELTTRNADNWRQFAGILRVFNIACEGAIQHRPANVPPVINVEIKYLQKEDRIVASMWNRRRPRAIERSSARELYRTGIRGNEVIKYLCKRVLYDLAAEHVTPDTDGGASDRYLQEFSFKRPEWIVPTESI